jgi:hypothetical protein
MFSILHTVWLSRTCLIAVVCATLVAAFLLTVEAPWATFATTGQGAAPGDIAQHVKGEAAQDIVSSGRCPLPTPCPALRGSGSLALPAEPGEAETDPKPAGSVMDLLADDLMGPSTIDAPSNKCPDITALKRRLLTYFTSVKASVQIQPDQHQSSRSFLPL